MLAREGCGGEDKGFTVTWRQFRHVDLEPAAKLNLCFDLKPGVHVKAKWHGEVYDARVKELITHHMVALEWLTPAGLVWPWQDTRTRLVDIVSVVDPLTLEVSASGTYNVPGGILCDKVGYGKTATTIGLIDSTLSTPVPEIPEVDRNNFVKAKGTLIIVPSNLWDQWLNEIAKFVYDEKPLRSGLKRGWSPEGCPMKIFAMYDVRHLTSVSMPELAEADVVLCSYRLLYSPIYVKRRQHIAGGSNSLISLMHSTQKLIKGTGAVNRSKTCTEQAASWTELKFPVLEMFYWRRVVFDEFHELESFESLQQTSLQHLRAHFRWGLTGTPPVTSNAGVIFMSSLFRIDLPGALQDPVGAAKYPDLAPWEADRLLTEQAGQFLDRYARQNTAELPAIGLEEHVVVVRHTPEERALYLGQAHDAPDPTSADAFATPQKVHSLERLLVLCSHFQVAGDITANATEECRRIGEMKQKRVVKARNQLFRGCWVLRLLGDKADQASGEPQSGQEAPWIQRLRKASEEFKASSAQDAPPALAAQELEEALGNSISIDKEELLKCLDGHRAKTPQLLELLGPPQPRAGHARDQWAALAEQPVGSPALKALVDTIVKEVLEALEEFREAVSSLDFFDRMVSALADNTAPQARSCCVCLDDDLPLDKLAITPCAHTFCMDCLKMTVEKFKSCSICRQSLSIKDIRAVSVELSRPSAALVAADGISSGSSGSGSGSNSGSSRSSCGSSGSSSSSSKGISDDIPRRRCGSKLAALVHKLHELRNADPTAKVILFVQFDDLKRKVAVALESFGIPIAQLHGSILHRANVIRDWQQNSDSATFVLLLSLAQSASGTNLTAASHVVFLHPMLAPSAEQAIGYELQAIGRARRHGQQRGAVHVWRFVTAETIEQAITERHQAALWAREQSREEAFAAQQQQQPQQQQEPQQQQQQAGPAAGE